MFKRSVYRTPGKNKFERETFGFLKSKGVNFSYEKSKLPYTIHGFYKPDYTVVTKRQSNIFLETKGYFRPEAKRKMVAVKKLNPELDIRLIFYGRATSKTNKTNIKWAEKYGFKYAFHTIPQEWLEEFKCVS